MFGLHWQHQVPQDVSKKFEPVLVLWSWLEFKSQITPMSLVYGVMMDLDQIKFFYKASFWSTNFWSSDFWNPWFRRSQVWGNKKFVITNELSTPGLQWWRETSFFYRASFWSTYIWSSDLWNPWFRRSQVWGNKKFVITNELSTPGLQWWRETSFFYKASFWSTYFWSSDLWNPCFRRSQVWGNKKFVITNEFSTPGLQWWCETSFFLQDQFLKYLLLK